MSSRFITLTRLINRQVNKTILICLLSAFVAVATAKEGSKVNKVYELNILSQPLSTSLNKLSDTARVSFLFPYELVEHKQGNSVQGSFTIQQALNILLADSNLKGEFINDKAFLIKPKAIEKDNKKRFKVDNMKTQKTVLASIIAMLFSNSGIANAEQTDDQKQKDDIEIISIQGVRSSIVNAKNEKMNASGIVDAYFAEDIGKSSDEDITGALQRLPGVTIERGGEGGDQGTVVVRGIEPALNVIKFNGVTLTSNTDSQAVDLSNYSADVLSSIIVAKSPSAEQEEGSLGGTVYLESAAPLSNKEDKLIVSLEGRYNDLTDSVTPRTTLSFAKSVSDTFAFSGSLFWDDNETRVDNFETFVGAFVDNRSAPRDTSGNTISDRAALADGFMNYRNFLRDSEKLGGTVSLQWKPDDTLDIRLDAAYSDQTQDFTMYEDRVIQASFGQDSQPSGLTVIDTASGRLTEYYGTLKGLLQTREQVGDTESTVLGLNIEKQLNDWTIKSRLAYSNTEQLNEFQTWNLRGRGSVPANASFGPGNGYCGFRISEGDGNTLLPQLFDCPAYNRNDVSTLGVESGSESEREVTDEFTGFYLDVERAIEHDIITAIKAGVKFTDREKDRYSAESFFGIGGLVDASRLVDGTLPVELSHTERTPGGTLAGIAPIGNISTLAPNIDAVNNLVFANGVVPADLTTRNPSNQWNVQEETQGAYIQLDYALDAMSIEGNFGVRYVETDVTSSGAGGFQFNSQYVQPNGSAYPAEFAFPDFVDKNTYSEVLPSFNIKMELSSEEELYLRGSVARVLARPNLDSLAPGFTVIDRDGGRLPTGSGGNAQLDPFVADQFDLSLEWYFSETGYISAGLFHKSIDSFTFSSTAPRSFANPVTGEECLVDRASAPADQQFSATVAEFGCRDVLYTSEVNGAEAEITGLEISYTQTFDTLPGIFQHLGVSSNYTYADSEAQVVENKTSPENGLPFPNTSENSFNSVLFWENEEYSFRLAHTYRDEALIQVNNNNSAIIRDARHTLDFSANWNVNDKLTLVFAAANLTDSFDSLYQATLVSTNPDIPVQVNSTDLSDIPNTAAFRVNHQGRSYRLSARYSF